MAASHKEIGTDGSLQRDLPFPGQSWSGDLLVTARKGIHLPLSALWDMGSCRFIPPLPAPSAAPSCSLSTFLSSSNCSLYSVISCISPFISLPCFSLSLFLCHAFPCISITAGWGGQLQQQPQASTLWGASIKIAMTAAVAECAASISIAAAGVAPGMAWLSEMWRCLAIPLLPCHPQSVYCAPLPLHTFFALSPILALLHSLIPSLVSANRPSFSLCEVWLQPRWKLWGKNTHLCWNSLILLWNRKGQGAHRVGDSQ